MYWPDTNTGVDIEPARKPVASAVRKFFTEGGVGQAPTVPGGDFFNQITNELLNVVEAAGLEPSKTEDNQLLHAIQCLTKIAFSSVLDLKSSIFINVGDIVSTKSYHSGSGYGGATYKIMTLADARAALSDPAFIPDDISSHYTFGGYVALITGAIEGVISVLQCGAGVSRSPSENSAAFASAISAMQAGTKITAGEVWFPSGNFNTEDPIVNIPPAGTVQRLVKLRGAGRGKTVITKTTTNSVGVRGVDVDAVLIEAPDVAADYAYFGDCAGFSLMREAGVQNQGYGYYAVKCAVRKASDLECNRALNGYYTDDCWMSELDSIWSLKSAGTGISILGGTSNTGQNLYSDGSLLRGYNFRGLTYSELHCSADSTGADGTANALAYDFELAKGVTGQFNCEKTRGSEFRFVNSDGVFILGGRSFSSEPVLAATKKITAMSSTVKFSGFDWSNSIANLSPADKLNYSMITRDSSSSIDFDQCVFSVDMDSKFPRQLDGKFAGSVSSKPYANDNGIVTHSVGLVQNTFKKLCYLGTSGRFKIDIGICEDAAVDAVYTPLDETGLFVGGISTNPASPTNVMKWNNNGAPSVATLLGYISDGWLMIAPSNSGNNRTYRFRVFTGPAF